MPHYFAISSFNVTKSRFRAFDIFHLFTKLGEVKMQNVCLSAEDLSFSVVFPWLCYRYEEVTVRDGSFHTSTVRVVNVSAVLDYAVFSCTARNALGEDVLDIQLVSTSTVSLFCACVCVCACVVRTCVCREL